MYEEVSSLSWVGNKKMREQVPVYEVGMSKLKIEETVEVMVPL